MLTNLFSKPLTLEIGEQTVRFESLGDFEFALAGRTDVPASKLAALSKLSAEELTRAAKNIKAVERQFVDLLTRSIESPETLNAAFAELEPDLFSNDHDWRQIVLALQRKPNEDYAELKRLSLVKYLQYLSSRQELIKHTYAVKQLEQDRSSSLQDSGQHPMKETVVLDSTVVNTDHDEADEMSRLPKGEAKLVSVPPGKTMEFRLSTHAFKLVRNGGYKLVDHTGETHELQEGKNIVGRDVACNVVIDASCRDISRLHLIVEPLASQQVRLTDLSSHGTFIPVHFFCDNDATSPTPAASAAQ